MLVFCDESWRTNDETGKKVGTLAAVAIPEAAYNDLSDRVFGLAVKYFGFENARLREIKGKQLLSPYEFRRETANEVSIKLSFARELLEELRTRKLKVFASIAAGEKEVDLLCESPDQLDRPYRFLMERISAYVGEIGPDERAIITFDDRGSRLNAQVGEAYRNFLSRSRTGRSFGNLARTPFFTYSTLATGIQVADLVCTLSTASTRARPLRRAFPSSTGS